jgi:hypothetical protein
MPHRTLKFTSVETTYVISDLNQSAPGTIDLTVKWEVFSPKQTAANGFPGPYRVTISELNNDDLTGRIYSLLTLGFQACDWESYIFLPNGVEMLDEKEQTVTDPHGTPVKQGEVPRADRVWDATNKRYVPNEDLIRFLKFNQKGPHVLFAKDVNRSMCGFTFWSDGSAGDGHDNTPPKNPPD